MKTKFKIGDWVEIPHIKPLVQIDELIHAFESSIIHDRDKLAEPVLKYLIKQIFKEYAYVQSILTGMHYKVYLDTLKQMDPDKIYIV